jgi:nucleotide-binding universal stress UspA family protein
VLDVRRLLVAIDLHRNASTLTAGSCYATDQAAELVKQLDAEVVLVHSMRADRSDSHDVAAHALDQVAERFRGIGAKASVEISNEAPCRAIIGRVLRDRIDLVFAGRRNEPAQHPIGLGSVSSQLVRNCPAAVWVVKPGGNPAPRCVLAASDLSPVGERVVEYAAFVARYYGAKLHVAHAFELSRGAELEGWAGEEEFVRRVREQRSRQLAEEVERAGHARGASLHVVFASPRNAILGLHEQIASDLVVMGTSRGHLLSRILGDTALRLLGRLDCSLLFVKPDSFVCRIAL